MWACAADLATMQQGPKVDLLFRDAANLVWHRHADGRIELHRRPYDWSAEYATAIEETDRAEDHDEATSRPI
ncbi:hypothetical protein CFN78_25505 [Amycolatopsis antarctica]|uniref:Uncharacterized protein n=1 Tax=Amycolatopsis antarctica TaxID=1854586 RepID=A0A263CWD8_9PSEU|nr:hypothetical protein CFN78_25505 [Amycolatopsis antarctica]